MPVSQAATVSRRVRSQSGFTMLMALGVLLVTSLLCAAVFRTIGSEVDLTHNDLNAKRAYAAAQAGLQAYKYLLNDNATNAQWWENCDNDTATSVPVAGSTTGVTYSYAPVPANGAGACSSADPAGSLIDTATGSLRMVFTGKSGRVTKSIVASFKTLSPLSFLWYTVHETVDGSVNSDCANVRSYFLSTVPPTCEIEWVTGDNVQGPVYTQDQLFIGSGQKPNFGRAGSTDTVSSEVPTDNSPQDVCVASNCQGATYIKAVPEVDPRVPYPTDNANLLIDAQSHGVALPGTVTLYIHDSTATAYYNCSTGGGATTCSTQTIDLTTQPIIYATNITSGCSAAPAYQPASNTGKNPLTYRSATFSGTTVYTGACGDIYVQGNYTVPMTIAADNDVIVTGDLTTTEDTTPNHLPTGKATAGLVANRYVRVMHTCTGTPANPDRTIDAGILALKHSFFVDNYDCGTTNGSGTGPGNLNVHGAIAQEFRGIVGTSGSTGYLKKYVYDPRLAVIFPPYMLDLQKTSWNVFRESLCNNTASGTKAAGGCSQ